MVVSSGIFLIGPMGSGKSTVGKCLADRIGREFFDSDAVIQSHTGFSVADIFRREGEKAFRQYEEQVIDRFTQKPDIVLATGGGTVLSKVNRRHLRERGTVICLLIDIDSQLERLDDLQTRPLLTNGDLRVELEETNRQRYGFCKQIADVFVDVDSRSIGDIVDEIVDGL